MVLEMQNKLYQASILVPLCEKGEFSVHVKSTLDWIAVEAE
jgi:hypothetical protein